MKLSYFFPSLLASLSMVVPVLSSSNLRGGIVAEEGHRELIIDGKKTKPGEYPFFGFPYHLPGPVWGGCGSALIHEDILVTAAHCNDFPDRLAFDPNTGAVAINRTDDKGDIVQDNIPIQSVRKHSEYDRNGLKNDIMLVKLKTPSKAPPAKWNNDAVFPVLNQALVVVGHGQTLPNIPFSPDLLSIVQTAVDGNLCGTVFNASTEICAGPVQQGQTVCNGDSGGPLFHPNGAIFGVVSAGAENCATNAAVRYTRLSAYDKWIRQGICEMTASRPEYCGPVRAIDVAGATDDPSLVTPPHTALHYSGNQALGAFGSVRWATFDFTYTIPNLKAGSVYTVKLGFAETYQPACINGGRVFDVAMQNVLVENDLDVFKSAGCNAPLEKRYKATADAAGRIAIQFKRNPASDVPIIGLIEIYESKQPARSIDVAGATDDVSLVTPAHTAVHYSGNQALGAYGYVRWATFDFMYTIPNLRKEYTYTVILGFAETYQPACVNGGRVFEIAISGTVVEPNFDVFQSAGGCNLAIDKHYNAVANSAGQITIEFKRKPTSDVPIIGKIEVVEAFYV